MKTQRTSLLGAISLLVGLVALPALADAPGKPDPQYESFVEEDRVITDRKTLLEWKRTVLKDSVKSVGEFDCGNTPFGGSVGRLPTIKELFTLFDEEPHLEFRGGKNVRKSIDRDAFGSDLAGNDFSPIDLPYWSQTPSPSSGKFWTLNFSTGLMEERAPSEKAHTRCVR